ncbi:MAG: MFS transporter [Pseudomonadales bacterium]
MAILFLVAFLDIVGFSIIIPIFVYYAMALGASAQLATMFLALYPLAMLLATPILGKLSDQYGRKPVLLVCLFGAIGGYMMLGLAGSLWTIAVARIIQGALAGNISVVQACVTDITTEENRTQGMGMIGAAIGLGFVMGPAIGSYLGGDNFAEANLLLPAIVSAVVGLMAFLLVLFFVPETHSKATRADHAALPKLSFFAAIGEMMRRPLLLPLIVCGLLFNVAAGLVEAIFPIWIMERGIISGPRGMMVIFLCAGLTLAVVQGKLVGVLAKRWRDQTLVIIGCVLYALGLLLVVWAASMASHVGVIAAMSVQAGAMGFIITPLQTMVSRRAGPAERGMVLGVFSSIGTLGRVIAPMVTGIIYASWHFDAPYFVSVGVVAILILVIIAWQRRVDASLAT